MGNAPIPASSPARLQYAGTWRLGFFLTFFAATGLVERAQIIACQMLPPLRQAAGILVGAFALAYSYRHGAELVESKRGLLRWLLLVLVLVWVSMLGLYVMIGLGREGEVWVLRGLSVMMLVLAIRNGLSFISDPGGPAPILALADLAYMGSIFLAALNRHYRQWRELAALTLGNLGQVELWAPSVAVLLFVGSMVLYLLAARTARRNGMGAAATI